MGSTEVIRRHAGSVGASTSPKLKTRMMEALGAQ
jgi:hypothetical protein